MLETIKKYQLQYPKWITISALLLFNNDIPYEQYNQSIVAAIYQDKINPKQTMIDLKDDITYYEDGRTTLTHTILIIQIPRTNKILHLARVDTAQGATEIDKKLEELGLGKTKYLNMF